MADIIEREELKRKLDAGAVILVDTLPETAFARHHLPGAINIPSDDIVDRAPDLLPDPDAEIVVYCANGPCKRSDKAAARLVSLGYRRVRDYHVGKRDWMDAGLPVEGDEAP